MLGTFSLLVARKRAVVGTCPPEKTFKGGNVVIGEKVLIGTFAPETTFKNFLVRLAWTIFPLDAGRRFSKIPTEFGADKKFDMSTRNQKPFVRITYLNGP